VAAPGLLHRVWLRSGGGRQGAPMLCAHAGGGANAAVCAWELLAGVVEASCNNPKFWKMEIKGFS
jgi:hypothetical protein